MIIGSHNSWSYKTPINGIIMKIFAFMGKCQRKDIIEQYERNKGFYILKVMKGNDTYSYKVFIE